ncbi:hypothetical protein AA0X95_04460 [Bacillus sp. 1P10SD]|uniref:hypothetical protein n=1 Tax=Bacillus sp. 1P10SD TaxID=3132265 RepID=UPI0039A5E216
MGLFRDIGTFAGKVAGVVIGGPIQVVGELTGVDLIEDIGKGVQKASTIAGETLGTFTDGAVGTVSGIIQEDPAKRDEGLSSMGNAIGTTAKGVYTTVKITLKNGADVIGGAMDGDMDTVKRGATGIVKTVAVGALAIGVVDFIDGADGIDLNADADVADADYNSDSGVHLVEPHTVNSDPGAHHVDPHYVNGYVRSDGTEVSGYWRDGDGDSSTHLTAEQGGGYIQTNPDGVETNNIG